MASKYDWDFIRPLDQSANIAAMAQGNQQINAGLAAMGNAVNSYTGALKQRNTDAILNALYQAQTSDQLPGAMDAVNQLQQQYGRGFDQAAVRSAVDQRGSVLSQRDMQAMQLQQAQAAQAAIPILNQASAAEAIRMGADANQMNALAALGINAGTDINRFGTNAQNATRYAAEAAERIANRREDVRWREQQAAQQQSNWQYDADFRADESDWRRGGEIAAENPKSSGYAVDANGNMVTVANSGVSRVDAYGALAGVRGIRNNNPGNLGFANQRGASRENGNGRFASFNTPEEGLGAMSRQLDLHFSGKSAKAKEAGRPLQSVTDIIMAWSPPNENNTAKYIADVSKQLGVSPTARLNLNDPKTKMALMKSIVQKENGGNPYTDAQYQSGISPRTASSAIGNVVPQAAMSKVTSAHQDALAKLEASYTADRAKAGVKGSLATTGNNVDTWAAANRGKDSTFFTNAGDLANMAKKDADFRNLPEAAQINVLNGAFAKMNDVNALQYVPDADLKKFINRESRNYEKSLINQHNQAKEAVYEQSYQNLVQAFQAAGSRPPSREAARQLFDPQAKPTPAKEAPAPNVARQAAAAVKPPTPVAVAPKAVNRQDQYLAERAKRKEAEWNQILKNKEKAKQQASVAKPVGTANYGGMVIPAGRTNLTQKDLDEAIKKLKR